MVLRTYRPWERSAAVVAGVSFQGRALSWASSLGWLALTVRTQWPPRAVIASAVARWVCMASAVITAPSRPGRRATRSSIMSRRAGISLVLGPTSCWATTAPVA